MELPFAVEQHTSHPGLPRSNSNSSLVTASSQGSLFFARSSEGASYDPLVSRGGAVNQVSYPDNSNNNDGLADVLSQFGVVSPPSQSQGAVANVGVEAEETIDFTYVNVCETDEDEVEILITGGGGDHHGVGLRGCYNGEGNSGQQNQGRGDILTLLLSGSPDGNQDSNVIVERMEHANTAALQASQSMKDGNLQGALDAHSTAAKCFRDAATSVRERNAAMASSLLLLSQTHARSALSLKRVVKLQPNSLPSINGSQGGNSQKDRLRATVRGALDNPKEADLSDSVFLGRAINDPTSKDATIQKETESPAVVTNNVNPVDVMMQLERELRDMDMALEMGNSIASLDAKAAQNNRMKSSTIDGSFMVVPPGSSSYMAPSSSHRGGGGGGDQLGMGTAGVRARANRVQNLAAGAVTNNSSTGRVHVTSVAPIQTAPCTSNSSRNQSLESSWWGNSSVASQVLASSVSSIASGIGGDMGDHGATHHYHGSNKSGDQNQQPANTKQLIRLMDALKTSGDENATLLREVEGAEAARREAKAAKQQMKLFKEEYGKRFATLKEALEKFRKDYPSSKGSDVNPVASSEFLQAASAVDQLQRQEQLIKKLTADLKKEKEDSKKKDAALRKYESFYREVKARSAQKAAQRDKETLQRQQQQQKPPTVGSSRH